MKKLITIISLIVVSVMAMSGCVATKFDENKNISVSTREDGSGTKSAFMEIIGLKGKKDTTGVVVGTGTAGILAEVEGNPHAIAYESLGFVTKNVKKLKVDNVEATIENIKNGTYKIARPLNIVYQTANIESGANKEFYTFLSSKDAQDIISKEGYVSTKDNAVEYAKPTSSTALTGKIDISGSTSLQPLMIKLADKFEKIHTNVDVTVGGGGSGTGYSNAENGTSVFGMISEEFNASKAPSCAFLEVAKDGIAMIVHTSNTFENISMAQLKNLYNVEQEQDTRIKTWADLKK